MTIKHATIGILCFFSFLFIQNAVAGGDAIKTMAEILIKLNHYPSDSEKEMLKKMISNGKTSDNEKVLATALINLEHYPTDADKKKLGKLIKDEGASKTEKELATIIVNLNHKPSASDKDKLKAMM